MAERADVLHHHGDLLSQRRAAYRPRLRGDRDRRHRALQAARRLRRVLPDRHRRARPEDAADGGARGHDRRRRSPTATAGHVPRHGRRARTAPTTDFIRTTEARPLRLAQEIWRRMEATGDIYLANYSGWYSVRDEAYYDESETTIGAGRRPPRARPARRSNGSRRRATSSASPPTRTGCSRSTRRSPTSSARRAAQRDRQLRPRAA